MEKKKSEIYDKLSKVVENSEDNLLKTLENSENSLLKDIGTPDSSLSEAVEDSKKIALVQKALDRSLDFMDWNEDIVQDDADNEYVDYFSHKETQKTPNLKLLSILIIEILQKKSSQYEPLSLDDIVDYLEHPEYLFGNRAYPSLHYDSREKAKDSIGKDLKIIRQLCPQIIKIGSKYYFDISYKRSDYHFLALDSLLQNKNIDDIKDSFTLFNSNKDLYENVNLDYMFTLNLNSKSPSGMKEFEKSLYKKIICSSLNRCIIDLYYLIEKGKDNNSKYEMELSADYELEHLTEYATNVRNYHLIPLCVIYYKTKSYLIAYFHNDKKKKLHHFDLDRVCWVRCLDAINNPLKKFISKQNINEEDVNVNNIPIMTLSTKDTATRKEKYIFYKYFIENICTNISKITFEFDVTYLSPSIVQKEFGHILFTPVSKPKTIDVKKIKLFEDYYKEYGDYSPNFVFHVSRETNSYTNLLLSQDLKNALRREDYVSLEQIVREISTTNNNKTICKVLNWVLLEMGDIYLGKGTYHKLLSLVEKLSQKNMLSEKIKQETKDWDNNTQTKMSEEFVIYSQIMEFLLYKYMPIYERPDGRLSVTVECPIEDFLSWAIRYYDKITINNKEILKELKKRIKKLTSTEISDNDEIEEVYIQLLNFKNEQLINKEFDTELMIVDANEKIYKFKTNSTNIKDIVMYAILNPNILRIHPRSDTAYDELQDKLRYLDKAYDDEF